jgi:hypothetical protein
LLDAAEWRLGVRNNPLIDADDSGFDRAGNAPHAAKIARIEIRRQAIFARIGESYGLDFGLEPDERRDRTEYFFAQQPRVPCDIDENGRLIEIAAAFMPRATDQRRRPFRFGIGDEFLDFRHGLRRDERALLYAVFESRPDLEGADSFSELPGKGVIDAGLNIETIGADAGLSGVTVFRGNGPADRRINVGIVEDDEGRCGMTRYDWERFPNQRFSDSLGECRHRRTSTPFPLPN